jgi:arylsulfatase A-like enzyme
MSDVDVIFVGDNGSSGRVVQAPWAADQAKETLFEGGVHVPLFVAGPSVAQPGRVSPALVHLVDLYATTGALFGLDPVADLPDSHRFDSISFLPVLASADAVGDRVFATTDGFGGNNDNGQGEAIRDGRFKLVRWADGSESAFDLEQDPYETDDLLGNDDHGGDGDRRSSNSDDDDDGDDDDDDCESDALDETELVARLDALSAQLDAYRADTGR